MRLFIILIIFYISFGCSQKVEKLPYLGNHIKEIENGQSVVKEYFTIPYFELINQDSIVITNNTFKDKIYVADFIFLSCPTICPIMNKELKRVYEVFKDNEDISFISHTIDPDNDSISVLKMYSEHLGVNSNKWHFLYGEKQIIYDLAESGYFSKAYKDSEAPGGYVHSGGFILVDKNRHIRGVYDGTSKQDVDRLIKEIVILLGEESN